MDINEVKKSFRTPDVKDYPELVGYSREEIYEGKMGPGGLYLAAKISRHLNLAPGQRVLDLGCGKGATSIFLAKLFDVTVFAVDYWIKAEMLYENIANHGLGNQIIPLNLDVTQRLPFAQGYFDAIFCMDAVHYFGTEPAFWQEFLPYLRSGGRLCIGSPCFNTELSEDVLANLPDVYHDGTDLWATEFSKYHSPEWWAEIIGKSGLVKIHHSKILDDGEIYWEDDILNNLEKGGDEATGLIDAAQVRFRQEGVPHLTHFVLSAEKCAT